VKRSWLTWGGQDWEPTGRVARALLPIASRVTGSRSYGADLLFLLRMLVPVAVGIALASIVTAEPGRTLPELAGRLAGVAAVALFMISLAVLVARWAGRGEDGG
jgi:hypothetical protein